MLANRGRLLAGLGLLLTAGFVASLALVLLAPAARPQLPPPTFGIFISGAKGSEADGWAEVYVARSGNIGVTASCQYATADDTATGGLDYIPATGTIVFAPGEVGQTVKVKVIDDPLAEPNPEYFWFELSNPMGADLISPSKAQVPIDDNEATPSATVAFEFSSWTYSELSVQATISVTMTGTPTGPVAVSYSTRDGTAKAGTNYTPATGVLVWQQGEAGQAKSFTITLLPNPQVDPTLTVNLSLSAPVNALLGSAAATLYITDADVKQCLPQ